MRSRRDTGNLQPTVVEQRLIDRVKSGEEADLGASATDGTSAGDPGIVRADVLWALLAGTRADWKGGDRVHVSDVRVEGRLDLSGLRIDRPIRFSRCVFSDDIVLSDARVDHPIEIIGGRVASVLAARMEAQADVVLRQVRMSGVLDLVEAELARDLRCTDSEFCPLTGVALDGVSMEVRGSVFLDGGFSAEGEVRLTSARVHGNLDLRGATLRNREGTSLQARRLVMDGDLLCEDGFSSEGEVCVQWAQLRALRASGALFSHPEPKGMSLRADAVHCSGGLYLDRGFRSEGQVRLVGADITGELCCTKGTFENPEGPAIDATRFHADDAYLDRGFTAHGQVCLAGGKLDRQLCCSKGTFTNPGGPALNGDGLICDGDVFLNDGFHATGSVRLVGATVERELNCTAGLFENHGGQAIEASGVIVHGNAYLDHGFRANGEVRLVRCAVDEQLMCTGSMFENSFGASLDVSGGRIRGDLLLNEGFCSVGEVCMVNTSIDRNLLFDGARLNGTSDAVNAVGMRVSGCLGWLPEGTPHGGVNFSYACVGRLSDREGSWPECGVLLTMFVYGALESTMPIKKRLAWLDRAQFAPQSYRQLATAFRATGQEDHARRALIAGERAQREHGELSVWAKAWNRFLDWSVGYGYRLHRTVLILVGLTLFNWVLYQWAADRGVMVPVGRGSIKSRCPQDYPCFKAVAYGFETLVPGINLRQVGNWLPNGHGVLGTSLLFWTWLCIVVGWVLGIAFGAGLSRLFARR
ncbi:hypothetical protein [Streptomyces sp. NPDC003077]|uniref:hypothetical protein n=1 Tax=Streptomyces sp. NPDC003077 TaxID=3154443 RepID=UPI0033BEEE85